MQCLLRFFRCRQIIDFYVWLLSQLETFQNFSSVIVELNLSGRESIQGLCLHLQHDNVHGINNWTISCTVKTLAAIYWRFNDMGRLQPRQLRIFSNSELSSVTLSCKQSVFHAAKSTSFPFSFVQLISLLGRWILNVAFRYTANGRKRI